MLSQRQKIVKRIFDIVLSFIGIVIFIIPIFILVIISTFLHKELGVFTQKRVGENKQLFTLYKIRSMGKAKEDQISSFGIWIRKYKLDELPQLFHVFMGTMSIVGPRPDVPGYADKLTDENELILSVKPGLTSEAAIIYSNEEILLRQQPNPLQYNDEILWPQKVALNRKYVQNYSFKKDIQIILNTIKTVITT